MKNHTAIIQIQILQVAYLYINGVNSSDKLIIQIVLDRRTQGGAYL